VEEILIPNDSQHDVVTFDMLVEGVAINPSYQILSISITREINRIPNATIIIRDGESSDRKFEISNTQELIPGNKVNIKVGRDGDNYQVFEGIITKHSIKVRENGNSELCLECRDQAYAMTLGRKSHYFEEVTDEQVFDELIGRHSNLTSNPDPTQTNHKELIQHHISDWDFLLLRAEAIGMLVSVDDGKINIFKPDTGADPVLQISYGSSILEFEATMDLQSQFKNIQAKSWDYGNQQLFEAETDSASFTEHGNIAGNTLADKNKLEYEMHHSGHVLEQELQDWVDGVMLRSRLAKIRGRAKFTGFSGVKPGEMVKLIGVGERFEGNSFVTAVKHEMGYGMWDTHIQFGLDPLRYSYVHKDVADASAAGLVGCIQGLQVGKVVQLENDPDGQDRILVKIPVIDNDAQGIWTRVASLDAGSDRGAFFRPEIDDEVIVGFINQDPRDAVVLGMLHSSANPAPITAQDVNHEKGFTTRSKMHIHFNDDTKTITIDTPAKNFITLDEGNQKIEIKDQNDNYILMEPSGIKMESPQNIEVKAGVNLSMEAGAAFDIKGATVTIKSDGNLTAEGAVSKFAAQGINEVKGSMVKIN